MQFDDVLTAVQRRVSYIRCGTSAASADGWVRSADLIADPVMLRREIDATAAGRSATDPQVAASLYVQSYTFRVPSLAVAAFALDLPAPSVSPAVTSIRITRHRPGDLAISDTAVAAIDATSLARALFDEHLGPLIDAVKATTQVGERLLWGNVAASIATIFRAVQSGSPLGDPAVRERAEEFFDVARAWLGGLGHWSTIAVPDALGWYFDRTTCCLYYQTGAAYCDDCSLNDPTQTAASRRADLVSSAAGTATP